MRLAQDLLSDLDLDAVLNRVLESAAAISGARYAALGVTNEARTELERFITVGVDAETRDRIGELPRGRGVLGELIARPETLRLANVGAHPHSYGFPAGHPPMSTFLGVPILVGGVPFGNLYLTEKAGGEQFTEQDEQTIGLLAEFAGVAIDHARRYTDLESRHRAEADRRRARGHACRSRGRSAARPTWSSILEPGGQARPGIGVSPCAGDRARAGRRDGRRCRRGRAARGLGRPAGGLAGQPAERGAPNRPHAAAGGRSPTGPGSSATGSAGSASARAAGWSSRCCSAARVTGC